MVIITKKLLPLLVLILFLFSSQATAEMKPSITFIVKSSSSSLFQTMLLSEAPEMVNPILQATRQEDVTEIPYATNYLLLEEASGIKVYQLDEQGRLYDVIDKVLIYVEPSFAQKLENIFQIMNEKHFGELLTWEEVNEKIPKYTTFMITDLQSGLSFQVQRRAGSNHMDVQPLTKEDTKIMKKIYNGKWSWNRRAILLHHEGTTIAASMHGMPHGGGALANNFPGHFCVHVKKCVTHTTRKENLDHQMMIHRAAGQLKSYTKQLSAKEVTEAFFFAINHQDYDVLSLISNGTNKHWLDEMKNVEVIRLVSSENSYEISENVVEFPITYNLKKLGQKEIEGTYTFRVIRDSPFNPWKLDTVDLNQRR